MIDAFIGLGANIEDPEAQLRAATAKLATLPDSHLTACSRVYRSAPMGPQDQPDFLNAVVQLSTSLSPSHLLAALQGIERQLGKVKVRHWGERCIDLDLLLLGDIVVDSPILTLPHPGIYQRHFVLQPLMDLVGPDYRMPNGRELGKLLAACSDPELVQVPLDLTPAKPAGEHR